MRVLFASKYSYYIQVSNNKVGVLLYQEFFIEIFLHYIAGDILLIN